jgi:hypothetical protein
MGRRLADHLGAVGMTKVSNECRLGHERIVIKCAKARTTSVGVTRRMLEHLDRIVGAFQVDDGSFELWSITPDQFKASMRESTSRGSLGRTTLVSRRYFEQHGVPMGRVRVASD